MFKRIPLLCVAALTGCVSSPPPPQQVRRPPPPRPVPPLPSVAVPAVAERPVTPGSWSYQPSPGGGTARFGTGPLFQARCDLASRRVALTVAGGSGTTMTLRASTTARSVAALTDAAGSTAQVTANDPILDALTFSRGSFAVTAGATTLTLPAWPEFTRVIEDCRG